MSTELLVSSGKDPKQARLTCYPSTGRWMLWTSSWWKRMRPRCVPCSPKSVVPINLLPTNPSPLSSLRSLMLRKGIFNGCTPRIKVAPDASHSEQHVTVKFSSPIYRQSFNTASSVATAIDILKHRRFTWPRTLSSQSIPFSMKVSHEHIPFSDTPWCPRRTVHSHPAYSYAL